MSKNEPTAIQAELLCKATAELDGSVIQDLLKSDGSLKELLDDEPPQDQQHSSDGGGC